MDDEREQALEKLVVDYMLKANKLRDALRLAQRSIIDHHNCTKMGEMRPGHLCPVCHKDGKEPVLDAIAAALQEAN